MDELATKDDIEATTEELVREIRRVGRRTTFSLATILGVMNMITFTALELC
jgi:hypothetical protein